MFLTQHVQSQIALAGTSLYGRFCCCAKGQGNARRSRDKAEALAAALGGSAEVADYADVAAGRVQGDVLMNSTSIGMHPDEDASPVDAAALGAYRAVFDAVYTPLETRLLKARLHAQ